MENVFKNNNDRDGFKIESVSQLKVMLAQSILNFKEENIESRVDDILTVFSYCTEEAISEFSVNKYVALDVEALNKIIK
jgi:hypothetical protein